MLKSWHLIFSANQSINQFILSQIQGASFWHIREKMGNIITQLKLLFFQNFIRRTNKINIVLDSDNGLFLPREILLEMLSWLTVEDLMRCKCVCKQWYAISDDRQFLKMHEERSEGSHSFYSLNATFEYQDMCDGLFLEKSKLSGKYRIKNPATNQILLVLPNPRHKSLLMGFSFRTSTSTYMVISIYDGKHEGKKGGCEVLIIGSGIKLSWRPLEIPKFANLYRKQEMMSTIFIDEIYHCARFHEDGSGEIVSFDLNKEDFTCLKVSENFLPDWRKVRIIGWNKKPAVYSVVQHELHVWVLEDYKKQKWADRKIIVPLTFLWEDPSIKECYIQYRVQSGIVWFKVSCNKVLAYCIESKEVVSTICGPEGEEISCYHIPSIITLKGMLAENRT